MENVNTMEDFMELSERIEHELEDAQGYAMLAAKHKVGNRPLSELYVQSGENCLASAKMMQSMMVKWGNMPEQAAHMTAYQMEYRKTSRKMAEIKVQMDTVQHQ